MIHHLSVGSNDVARARRFYDPSKALPGVNVIQERDTAVDYRASEILFNLETRSDGRSATTGNGVHIAFQARDRGIVDRFHAMGLANGGNDAVRPACGSNMTPATMVLSCSIPMATRSRQ